MQTLQQIPSSTERNDSELMLWQRRYQDRPETRNVL